MASVKALVEQGNYRILVMIIRCEFRRRQWQIELREDHLSHLQAIDE